LLICLRTFLLFHWKILHGFFHQGFSLGNNSPCKISLALQFNAMHALCVRLPAMFVLELSAADGTLEGRLFTAFHPYVVLQGAAPQVTLTALKANPLPQIGWKRQKVFVIFSIGKQVLCLFYATKPPSLSLFLSKRRAYPYNVSEHDNRMYDHNRIYCVRYLLRIKAVL